MFFIWYTNCLLCENSTLPSPFSSTSEASRLLLSFDTRKRSKSCEKNTLRTIVQDIMSKVTAVTHTGHVSYCVSTASCSSSSSPPPAVRVSKVWNVRSNLSDDWKSRAASSILSRIILRFTSEAADKLLRVTQARINIIKSSEEKNSFRCHMGGYNRLFVFAPPKADWKVIISTTPV